MGYRRTVTGRAGAAGRQQFDWTADYRLLAFERVDRGEVFAVARREVGAALAPKGRKNQPPAKTSTQNTINRLRFKIWGMALGMDQGQTEETGLTPSKKPSAKEREGDFRGFAAGSHVEIEMRRGKRQR